MAHNAEVLREPTPTGRVGLFDGAYVSARQTAGAITEFKDMVYPELMKDYGEGFHFYDMIRAASNPFTMTSDRMTFFVETNDETLIHLNEAQAANPTPNTTIYTKLDSDDYNTDGNTYLRKEFIVYFDPQYFTFSGAHQALPVAYKVTETYTAGTYDGRTAGTGVDTIYQLKPLNALTVIAAELPIGLACPVGESKVANGTGPVRGIITNNLQYQVLSTTLREACEGIGGIEKFDYKVGEQIHRWERSTFKSERRMDRQLDYLVTMGQNVTNTGITMTNKYGASVAVLGTQGVFPGIQQYGQALPVSYGSTFEFDDFAAIKEFQEAKGEMSGEFIFAAATYLFSDVEACPMAEIVAGNSPGTDLNQAMNSFGVPFRRFTKDSRNYTLCELTSLGRPTGFGCIESMKYQGLIMSNKTGAVSADMGGGNRQKFHFMDVSMGFPAGREMMSSPRGGINNLGYPNSDGYDAFQKDFLTETMVFHKNRDKFIHVYKAGATS